ncbi:MAG: hypothetical protein PUP92_07930 [Rhizonema sp. PD38]|nr:hypothetical protein [Rhizonema sp. PD38]
MPKSIDSINCFLMPVPETVPMRLLGKWLQIFGLDIATAMSAATPPLKGIDPGTPYTELYRRLNLLNQLELLYSDHRQLATQFGLTPEH